MSFATEPRIEQILHLLLEFARGNLEARVPHSKQGDALDAITESVNMLGEELRASMVSKAFLESVLQSIDPLIVLDSERIIHVANQAVCRSLSYAAHELAGRHLEEILFDESGCKSFFGTVRTWFEDDPPVRDMRAALRTRDGSLVPVVINCSAIRTAGGQLEAVVLAAHDITERLRLEEERERHHAELAAANEAKDIFFNTLSHELRTPLAAIQNAVEVLKSQQATPAQAMHMLELVERNLKLQARLIDDLLDLSRIMRKKVTITSEEIDLREVMQAQIEALKTVVHENRLSLTVKSDEQPLLIWGDPLRIGQVIANLLTNALKFTPAGGQITVTALREGDQAVLRVKDSGIGIPAEMLTLIFEPFLQAGKTTIRSQEGLGIGLAIAKSLTEMQHGKLEASSAGAGMGSEFVLRLPAHKATPAVTARPPPQLPLRPQRILLVEDNADVSETLAAVLTMLGHHVLSRAASGLEALAFARLDLPDVALVDIGLPDMDGYELARRLREDSLTAGVRLIALTGYVSPEHRERALRAGFDDYLAKPVGRAALQHALATTDQTVRAASSAP